MRISTFIIALFSLLLCSCEGFFGDKTDLDFIDKPVYQGRDIAYVPLQPVLDNFVRPTQIMAGYDQLIYVVDEGTSEIVSMDVSGRELQRIFVQDLTTISQDRALDILAIGTIDTVGSSGESLKLSCIYRINQKKGNLVGLKYGSPKPVIVHPYYTGNNNAVSTHQNVKFTGVACLSDYSYYITRSGPNNNPLQLGGPDDAVLAVFPSLDGIKDSRVSPISVQTSSGFETDYFVSPSAITTLAKPPQDPSISTSRDFVYTSIDANLTLKTQYIKYEENLDGGIYSLKELASGDTSKADGFLYEPQKFKNPASVTIAGDRTNYIFVVDSEKDSLFQFTNEGYEGVNPPAFSADRKQINCSFGGRGTSLSQFNSPTGVTYLDQIVYVADAGNGRVLRFKLTTDFD
ncbi:MAG: hypothetical protein ACPGEG_04655 [Salibacteraceae bacterium]